MDVSLSFIFSCCLAEEKPGTLGIVAPFRLRMRFPPAKLQPGTSAVASGFDASTIFSAFSFAHAGRFKHLQTEMRADARIRETVGCSETIVTQKT